MTVIRARASAPASIGNVGIGYDVLGQAFDAARDRVTAIKESEPGVRLGTVSGLVNRLPARAEKNCALAAALSLLNFAGSDFGVRLDIEKGVPLSAGMGGSAASAVAAAAAVNALLPQPYETQALLPFAMEGERVSADPPPWDNVMASLLGGLVIAARLEAGSVFRLPVPKGVAAILFHPAQMIETQSARNILKPDVSMTATVEHSRRLGAFVAGCCTGDMALIRAGLDDQLVEPQRAHLLPGFCDVKHAAMEAGALGFSFSGSGPSVFAWTQQSRREGVKSAMTEAFASNNIPATAYEAPLDSPGVIVEFAE